MGLGLYCLGPVLCLWTTESTSQADNTLKLLCSVGNTVSWRSGYRDAVCCGRKDLTIPKCNRTSTIESSFTLFPISQKQVSFQSSVNSATDYNKQSSCHRCYEQLGPTLKKRPPLAHFGVPFLINSLEQHIMSEWTCTITCYDKVK